MDFCWVAATDFTLGCLSNTEIQIADEVDIWRSQAYSACSRLSIVVHVFAVGSRLSVSLASLILADIGRRSQTGFVGLQHTWLDLSLGGRRGPWNKLTWIDLSQQARADALLKAILGQLVLVDRLLHLLHLLLHLAHLLDALVQLHLLFLLGLLVGSHLLP